MDPTDGSVAANARTVHAPPGVRSQARSGKPHGASKSPPQDGAGMGGVDCILDASRTRATEDPAPRADCEIAIFCYTGGYRLEAPTGNSQKCTIRNYRTRLGERGGILAALRRSPMVGAKLDLTRAREKA